MQGAILLSERRALCLYCKLSARRCNDTESAGRYIHAYKRNAILRQSAGRYTGASAGRCLYEATAERAQNIFLERAQEEEQIYE